MSLVSATPTVNMPSYEGLGRSLSRDLAPLMTSATAFMTKLRTYVTTTDGLDVPGGNADLFQGATPGEDGSSAMEQLFRSLRLNDRLLTLFVEGMSPTGSMWTDPFSALMQLGHKMSAVALTALGLAGLLNSTTGTAATAVWSCAERQPRRRWRHGARRPLRGQLPGDADLCRADGHPRARPADRLRAADDPRGSCSWPA